MQCAVARAALEALLAKVHDVEDAARREPRSWYDDAASLASDLIDAL